MALQEAKLMGLDLLPDPETLSNAPRDGTRAAYLYDNSVPEDWGSTASESEDDDPTAAGENDAAYMLETGGLTDREIDRLDGKTSNRLGKPVSSGAPAASATDKTSAASAYPERETGANTGPKGVLADQKYHRQQQYQERMSSQQAHNARMVAKAPTTTTYREDAAREKKERELLEGLEDEEEDEDEKKILDRIRGNRMQDLTWAAKSAGAGAAGGLAGRKMFGSLMEMNAAQYVSAIETEKKDVAVIIHIYSEYNPACKKLDGCLIRLAARYATTKFIRIKAMEVDFDEEVCPTVLVYRAGELIANLVMITYELSDDFDDAELEELFTKQKVLSPHDQYQRENSFFEQSLDSSSRAMASMSSPLDDFNMMSLSLSVGDSHPTAGRGSGSRAGGRGILSGNVKEFRYQDYDDDDDEI
ncbi:hypothetical protein BGZ75_008236 [Mortierella antarctica]|nr:hypothetical protein BGZ75_008236 [Mortierella antarctica]